MLERATDDAIARAAVLIREGGCVAFPTETVYGLGADATNAAAVAHIFTLKERPHFDPLIVHLSESTEVSTVVGDVPAAAAKLMEVFWPGPLTIVMPKLSVIPDIVTAGLTSVAIRVPDHPVARDLIRRSGRPIAAPSANPFGYVSPTRAAHVVRQLGERIPMVLDGGACRVGLESTIISFVGDQPTLLRHGVVTIAAIEAHIGRVAEARPDSPIQAPGQLRRHYSPSTPVTIVDSPDQVADGDRSDAALLSIGPVAGPKGFARVEVLSPSGDLEEAAAALFAALRDLDESRVEHIFAIAVPPSGIGRAIMDRLRRAAER